MRRPSASAAKTMLRPSGDTTGGLAFWTAAGIGSGKRTTGAGSGARRVQATAKAMAPSAASAHAAHATLLASPSASADDRRQPHLRAALRHPLQFGGDVARGLPAILRILRQAARHDPLERRRRDRHELLDRPRLGRENGCHHARRGLALERAVAREQLVEHAAEREDVGARIDLARLDLLGRHVVRRADDRVRAGERGDAWPARPPPTGAGPDITPEAATPPASPGRSRAA